MKTSPLFFLAILALFFAAACVDDDDIVSQLQVPETYEFTRNGESTVSFSGQATRIAMAEELAAATLDPSRSLEELNNMFRNPEGSNPFSDSELNESTKSIRSKVAASAALFGTDAVRSAEIKADFDGWLAAQVSEVFPFWNELAAPGQAGQIADASSTRYINDWGLEYDQAFTKSLIAGLMVDQINNHYLTTQVLDAGTARLDNEAEVLEEGTPYTYMEHRWDEGFGYVFGASATPATPLTDLQFADSYLNKYLGRVEGDPDYTGIATSVEQNFRTGRQAIVENNWAERDKAAQKIMEELEKVILIRAVYYLKQGEANLRATPIQRGTAFHDLSEGYGFIYGIRFLQSRNTDAIVDFHERSEAYLARLRNAEGNGWWDINPDVLADLAQEISDLGGLNLEAAAN